MSFKGKIWSNAKMRKLMDFLMACEMGLVDVTKQRGEATK